MHKLNEKCLENFWIWFEKQFVIAATNDEVSVKMFNQIESRFIDIHARSKSDGFDRQDVEREFWKLVFVGRKFIKALSGGQHD